MVWVQSGSGTPNPCPPPRTSHLPHRRHDLPPRARTSYRQVRSPPSLPHVVPRLVEPPCPPPTLCWWLCVAVWMLQDRGWCVAPWPSRAAPPLPCRCPWPPLSMHVVAAHRDAGVATWWVCVGRHVALCSALAFCFKQGTFCFESLESKESCSKESCAFRASANQPDAETQNAYASMQTKGVQPFCHGWSAQISIPLAALREMPYPR